MKYRTDLALECKEIAEKENIAVGEEDGILFSKREYGDNVEVTKIEILDERGEKLLEKPQGTYITIEAEGIIEEEDGVKETAQKALAAELANLVPFHNELKVLVVGLGNNLVTPDSLGPLTLSKIRPTRHLFEFMNMGSDDEMSNVSCIIPGVMGNTGVESAELIKKATELVQPEMIIIVDSLAARDMSRLSTTIQITDTGISPGAGMGNNRAGINKESMGVKVIAVGVPTVIDITTVLRDSLIETIEDLKTIENYLDSYQFESIVTSTDIDVIIKEFSDVIANGINKVLHPGIYS